MELLEYKDEIELNSLTTKLKDIQMKNSILRWRKCQKNSFIIKKITFKFYKIAPKTKIPKLS